MSQINNRNKVPTQKDTVFKIIKNYLGNDYNPDISVKEFLWNKDKLYLGDNRRHGQDFISITKLVYKGLLDGSVPTKLKNSYQIKEYATRITHYWLKNDPRLNGGVKASQMNKRVSVQTKLKWAHKTDRQLQEMCKLLNTVKEVDQYEVKYHILIRKIELMIEAFEIDQSSIPNEFLIELEPYIGSKKNSAA